MGPASSLYGANAFSAVINLITRSGKSIGGTEISLGRGQDRTRFEKLLWGGEAKGLEYALSASRYSTDGPRFRERHPNYSASYVDNATSLWARLSWRGWRLSAYRYDRPMGYGQFVNPANAFFGLPLFGWEQSEGQAVNNSLSPVLIDGREGTRWRSVTHSAVLGYTRQIGNNLDMETRLYHRRTGIDDDSYQYAFFLDREFAYVPFTHDSTLNGIDLQANYAIAPGRALIVGLSAEDSDVEKGYRGRRVAQESPRISTNIDERVGIDYRNRSVFAQYRHDSALLGGTRYTLGVRADRNRVYGDTVIPRLGIVSTPFSRATFKAMYGEAYRAPNAFDSFAETDVRIANPDLKPEYLRSLEFTAAWQITPAWRVEAGLFHNRITDGIVSNVPIGDLDGDGDIDTQNRNASEARIEGIELRGYWQARPSLSVFVFADRQQPRQEQQGATYPVKCPGCDVAPRRRDVPVSDDTCGRRSLHRAIEPAQPSRRLCGHGPRLRHPSPEKLGGFPEHQRAQSVRRRSRRSGNPGRHWTCGTDATHLSGPHRLAQPANGVLKRRHPASSA